MAAQLEFFSSSTMSELDYLRSDVNAVRESNEKVRKSMFARHGELARKYAELSERMHIIERNICMKTTSYGQSN
jgi:hypothetical protein